MQLIEYSDYFSTLIADPKNGICAFYTDDKNNILNITVTDEEYINVVSTTINEKYGNTEFYKITVGPIPKPC